jgi:hypothetical protein
VLQVIEGTFVLKFCRALALTSPLPARDDAA